MFSILKKLFINSYTKTVFFLIVALVVTYYTIRYGWQELADSLKNWRSKEFWNIIIIGIPILALIPIYLNSFLFLKIVQIADNTNETNKLLRKLIKLQEQQKQSPSVLTDHDAYKPKAK